MSIPQDSWPVLMQWRQQIAAALAEHLPASVLDRPKNFTPSPWSLPDPPFVLVASGDPYIEPFDSETSTFCTHRVNLRVGLIGGKPGDFNAELLVESWVERLPTAIRALNDSGELPVHALAQEGDVGQVAAIEFGGLELVGAIADVSAEINYEAEKET